MYINDDIYKRVILERWKRICEEVGGVEREGEGGYVRNFKLRDQ